MALKCPIKLIIWLFSGETLFRALKCQFRVRRRYFARVSIDLSIFAERKFFTVFLCVEKSLKFQAKFLFEASLQVYATKSPLHPLSQLLPMPHWLEHFCNSHKTKRQKIVAKETRRKTTSGNAKTCNRNRIHRILAVENTKWLNVSLWFTTRPLKTTLRKLCRSAPFPTATHKITTQLFIETKRKMQLKPAHRHTHTNIFHVSLFHSLFLSVSLLFF